MSNLLWKDIRDFHARGGFAGSGDGGGGGNIEAFRKSAAKTFYCNYSTGSDSVDGRDPAAPLKTAQAAINKCTAGVGDRVIMMATETVTTAVLFNKSRIIVQAVDYGLSDAGRGEFIAFLSDAAYTNGPAAKISAPCRVEGLGFVSRDVGTTFFSGAALLIGGDADANPFGVHISRCRFPKWNVSNRMGIGVEGSTDCTIEGCTFEGVGAAFAMGIYVQGACQNLNIVGNRFRQCTYAITHGAFAGGGPHCFYARNYCEDAKLLDSGTNTATGLICDNFLETATNATSYDGTVATLKGYGLNFSGNHYSE